MISSLHEPTELRRRVQGFYRTDERSYIRSLSDKIEISQDSKIRIYNAAKQIVEKIRDEKSVGLINSFMREYDLSNDEGIALMCLAESLLRIPDDCTIDELIKDKIADGKWGRHLGQSSSVFVNASTWGLVIGGYILKADEDSGKWYSAANGLLKKMGEPLIRKVVKQAMLILGNHFVMGQTIEDALSKVKTDYESRSVYSYDILGEAAKTKEDAENYFNSYMYAIKSIGNASHAAGLWESDGISVKLSALCPRYEFLQIDLVMSELLPKILELCVVAKDYNITLCIDAEEADRLEMSLIIFESLRLDPTLSGWYGLGIAVQSYQKRAYSVIDFIEDVAIRSNHKVMIRLVKGAYWDYEIKMAQESGMSGYPVFTRKVYTDISYLACATKILSKVNNFYPCFATHNAYTIASILEVADRNHPGFEFQRLYGMGDLLYDYVLQELAPSIRCRIYAPVGTHKELLPYLIRRLLENGANSSFVNKIGDANVKSEDLIEDPLEKAKGFDFEPHQKIPIPGCLFGTSRENSSGIDISDSVVISKISCDIKECCSVQWEATPIVGGKSESGEFTNIINPANLEYVVGQVSDANAEQSKKALDIAYESCFEWNNIIPLERSIILEKAADLTESESTKLISMLITEAGKTISDAISEIREAVDFLRYYAMLARTKLGEWKKLPGPVGEDNFIFYDHRGVFLCISPWNFPFAIFIGQVAAALVAGNAVLAKPAEQTPLIAYEAVRILHKAGVPQNVLHFLPGDGETIGKTLIPDNRISGVAFTGSTETALIINRMLAHRDGPIVPFIAETGGMNAMIVDSSALLEQVTTDVVNSAFKSAGQRCSCLRVLFIQEEIADKQIKMVCGAMQELKVGDPMNLSTDIGPIIDQGSLDILVKHTKKMSKEGELLCKSPLDKNLPKGNFFVPHAYEIKNISQLKREVFGPILHVIRYKKADLNHVINDINKAGYGLTFAVQSRVQSNIDYITKRARVGNIYVNRNQIGAVVGVQPFGGRGLSGTGPKAGGPDYLTRFSTEKVVSINTTAMGGNTTLMCLED